MSDDEASSEVDRRKRYHRLYPNALSGDSVIIYMGRGKRGASGSENQDATVKSEEARASKLSRALPLVPSASEADNGPPYYPGFEEDARTWGLQTSAAIGVGVVMGWIKGARDSAHLAGTYGRGSVYHGTFAEFRVPSNYVQAAIQSASWGWRVGIFTASFSALNLYLERKRGALSAIGDGTSVSRSVDSLQSDPLTPRERAEYIAAGGGSFLPCTDRPRSATSQPSQAASMDVFVRVLPSAGAGGLVGGSFGVLRQGGLRGAALGGLLGLGLGGGLKGLEVVVGALVEKIEAEESAKMGSTVARQAGSRT